MGVIVKTFLIKNNDGMKLQGELTLATVGKLFKDSQLIFNSNHNPICLDLSDVSLSDSAGVALLAAWVQSARHDGKQIQLKNIPSQMWATIHVSGLTDILPITNHS